MSKHLNNMALGATLTVLVVAFLARLLTLVGTFMLDPPEPWEVAIQAVAGAWLHGQPLYPSEAQGDFYGLLYGPLLFEIVGFTQRLVGIGSPLTAFPMALAELAALAVTFTTLRRMDVSRPAALAALGVMVVEISLVHIRGVRADAWLLLLAAIALSMLPGLERGSRWAAFGAGLCGGLCMALKISGIVYVVPALLTALLRPGLARRPILAAALGGVIVGFVPPYLPSGTGLADHLAFLLRLRPMAVVPALIAKNLRLFAAIQGAALLWSPSAHAGLSARLFAATGIAALLVLIPASLEYAGTWHLAPLLPATALYLGRTFSQAPTLDRRRLTLLPALCGLALVGIYWEATEGRDLIHLTALRAPGSVALSNFLAEHPLDSVAIGVSTSNKAWLLSLQNYQTELVTAGHPLLLTRHSWDDMATGAAADLVVRRLLADCPVRYFLMRPNEQFMQRPADSRITDRFLQLYALVDSTDQLDVWECRMSPHHPPVDRLAS